MIPDTGGDARRPDDRTIMNLKAMRHTLECLTRLANVALAAHLDVELRAVERRLAQLADGGDKPDETEAWEARRVRLWRERDRCDGGEE